MAEFRVTPWEVEGEVDYDRLVKEFGLEVLTGSLRERLKMAAGGEHMLMRRGFFFSHRDLGWLLERYGAGEKFVLYTGRAPSGHTHLGHLTPWLMTKWLQDRFRAKLLFQIPDEEKFLARENLTMEDTRGYAYENILDIIALGFRKGRTEIFLDTEFAGRMYPAAVRVAKRITFSTAKAAFGFTDSTNIGHIFYTAMQAVPSILESVKKGKNVPCLIPHGVDQDPHFRVARDVLPKMGFYKPAQLECKLLPGLGKGGKMSASIPETCVFTTDSPESVKKKVANAFTGGRDTVKEQRESGGNPDVCPLYQYEKYLFEPDDSKLKRIHDDCVGGCLLCGEHKAQLTEKINRFLGEHQKKRKAAKKLIDEFVVRE